MLFQKNLSNKSCLKKNYSALTAVAEILKKLDLHLGLIFFFQGLGIPIVTLLLEGGIDAIRIIKDRLKEGIAAVIIEGSGRAADIIAYAYRNATKNSIS